MAENNATETDIYQQQKKTIDTLINVLEQQSTQPPQIVYAQAAAEQEKPKTNYLLYIGIAIVAFIFLKKGRIL